MDFNIDGALDRLDNDKDILKMMISDFLETDKNISSEFSSFLEKKDLESIRSLAHRMKGCLLSLGAETLGEEFKDLERGIKEGRYNLSDAGSKLPGILSDFDEAYIYYEQFLKTL